MSPSTSHQTLHSFQWSFIEKFGKVIFQLAQIVILTRFLSKDDFGLVALALVSIEFSYLFVDAGLNAGILYIQNASQRALSSVFWLNLGLAVLLYGALCMVSPLVGNFYEEPLLTEIIPLLGLNILLLAIGRQHRTYLQKSFAFKSIALVEITAFAMALILALLLAIEGYGLYSLVYSTLLASLISNLSYLFLRLRKEPITFEFDWKELQPFINLGKYQMGSRILDFISRETDIFVIGKTLGVEILGLYSLTKQLVLRLFNLINPIVTNVLSPWLSSLQEHPEKQKEAYLNITRYLTYINLPIYLTIGICSFEILNIMYGTEYTSGSQLLFTLTVYYAVLSITNPVGSLQISTGRTDLGFYWTTFRACITPLAIYLGVITGGIQGVAWVLLFLSIGLIYPLWWVQIRNLSSIRFSTFLEQFYRPLIIYLFLGSFLHFAIKPLLNQPANLPILMVALVGLCLPVGTVMLYDRLFITTIKELWGKIRLF